ncbi:RNA polymerase sigma factor [Streptomyces longisporoflavus]|uniref:RNA polymerase sigma factor n=1 Tax=Streptomyces longisporoflavus TaxID=28044 RepID=UPI00167ECA9B|nr:sigma-70 family RNA polymerase sigma factor [Streptomyces longisporoflavus]
MTEPAAEPPAPSTDESFDELFENGFTRLVRSLVLLGAGRATAEDLTQDAFGAAYEKWAEVAHYGHPIAWVARTALNMWRQHCRTAQRRDALLARADPRQLVKEYKDFSEVDRRLDIQRTLARLPLRQREVVVLHYILDQPVSAVARTLEVAEGTVKSQLYDARRTLAGLLAGEDAERDREGGSSGPDRV